MTRIQNTRLNRGWAVRHDHGDPPAACLDCRKESPRRERRGNLSEYPPDFWDWPEAKRNAFFKAEADAFKVQAKATSDGVAEQSKTRRNDHYRQAPSEGQNKARRRRRKSSLAEQARSNRSRSPGFGNTGSRAASSTSSLAFQRQAKQQLRCHIRQSLRPPPLGPTELAQSLEAS